MFDTGESCTPFTESLMVISPRPTLEVVSGFFSCACRLTAAITAAAAMVRKCFMLTVFG